MSSNKRRGDSDDDSDQDHHSSKPGKCLLLRTSRIDGISSNYSQGRSYSSPGVIDEKSSRNGQTENGSYNVAPKALSDARIHTKKRSCSFVRPPIRSSVPNSPTTTIVKRPSQPGHVGQQIDVYANHFQIKLSKQENEIILYQFDIDVELLTGDGSWRSCNKYTCLEVLKRIIEQGHFPLVWYDDKKCLYTFRSTYVN